MAKKSRESTGSSKEAGDQAFELTIGNSGGSFRAVELGVFLFQIETFIASYEALMEGNPQGLMIESISTNSPIKFAGYCSASALLLLSVAVSIAGGDADIKIAKFHVNSLASAIERLNEATKKTLPISPPSEEEQKVTFTEVGPHGELKVLHPSEDANRELSRQAIAAPTRTLVKKVSTKRFIK